MPEALVLQFPFHIAKVRIEQIEDFKRKQKEEAEAIRRQSSPTKR